MEQLGLPRQARSEIAREKPLVRRERAYPSGDARPKRRGAQPMAPVARVELEGHLVAPPSPVVPPRAGSLALS